jgi:hypothetical protein
MSDQRPAFDTLERIAEALNARNAATATDWTAARKAWRTDDAEGVPVLLSEAAGLEIGFFRYYNDPPGKFRVSAEAIGADWRGITRSEDRPSIGLSTDREPAHAAADLERRLIVPGVRWAQNVRERRDDNARLDRERDQVAGALARTFTTTPRPWNGNHTIAPGAAVVVHSPCGSFMVSPGGHVRATIDSGPELALAIARAVSEATR